MGDHDDALDAEERGAAVFRVVHAAAKRLEHGLEQSVSHPMADALLDFPREEQAEGVGQTFADLERDVADEPVADDDIRRAQEDVPAFEVPDEGKARAFEKAMGLSGESFPLAASSPMDRRPTLGSYVPNFHLAYAEPMTAKWRRCSGLQSMVAPASIRTEWPF